MVGAVPGAWACHRGGAIGVVTGVALQGMNGVWGVEATPDASAIADLLEAVATSTLPYCMQLRPGWPWRVVDIAREHGMRRVAGEPVMVLDDARRLAVAQAVPGLTVRQLAPAEGAPHAAVVAAGFGHPDETSYRQLMSEAVLSADGVRCYVGEVDGRPVTTCAGVTVDECVAIFSVATTPDSRRHGYGAAVTARAVADGFAAGARWAWLSSSVAGFDVYQGLGFRVVERWDFWESTGRGAP